MSLYFFVNIELSFFVDLINVDLNNSTRGKGIRTDLRDVADGLINAHVEEDDVGENGLLIIGGQVLDDPQSHDEAAIVLEVGSRLEQLHD